jgi:hypothetical protein
LEVVGLCPELFGLHASAEAEQLSCLDVLQEIFRLAGAGQVEALCLEGLLIGISANGDGPAVLLPRQQGKLARDAIDKEHALSQTTTIAVMRTRADIHIGAEYNALQSEAGYIDARPPPPMADADSAPSQWVVAGLSCLMIGLRSGIT